MAERIEFTREELAGSVTISASEYTALRDRIAELEAQRNDVAAELRDAQSRIAELEAAQRPPIAYVVARDRGDGPSFHPGFYGSIDTAREALSSLPGPKGVRNFVAELREVQP